MKNPIQITLYTLALSMLMVCDQPVSAAGHNAVTPVVPPASFDFHRPVAPVDTAAILLGEQPVYFIENNGQITDQYGTPRPDIDFRIPAGKGLNVFIGPGKVHYQWSREIENGELRIENDPASVTPHPSGLTMYRLDVTLVGAQQPAAVIAEDRQSYHEQYYLPHCGPDGVKAHAYRRITYREVYPNIDWVLYITDNTLEYDFVVHPGGRISDIRLQYSGATNLRLRDDGSLIVVTPEGSVTEQAPYSFVTGGRQINSRFLLEGDVMRFAIDAYDPGETLTIDPVVQWATYYGGSDGDYRGTVVCDADGNVYLSGDAASRNNIATTGSHQSTSAGNLDAFLVKFNSAGVRQWATFYGGMDHDYSWQVTCDRQQHIYIVGQTYSNAGIATPGSHQMVFGGGVSDAYLVKFDSSGVRQWGTYYGGGITSGANGVDYGYAVACDHLDNVYIAGYTTSTFNIAGTGAHQAAPGGGEDAFIAKFNSAGVRQWGTYYGGADEDQVRSLACDNAGNLYAAGYTTSTGNIATPGSHQPVHGGRYDGFLVKFNASGVRQWGTYYGGSEIDRAYAVHWDESGLLYLAGDTYSATAIATPGSHQPVYGGSNRQDAFLARFNDNGVRQWGTYYGGTLDDEARSLTTDIAGNIYMAGFASSVSGIATAHGPQAINGGGQDAFLVKFSDAGVRDWATYYGGSGFDYGYSVAIDGDRIYMSGQSNSLTGIATSGSHQDGFGGGYYDNYLVRFNDCEPPSAALTYEGDTLFCMGDSLVLQANTGPGLTWQWQQDGMDIPGANSVTYAAGASGSYTVTVYRGSCGTISDPVKIEVLPRPETPAARNNGPLCNGQTLHLAAPSAGAVAWSWTGPALFTTTARSPSLADMQLRNAGVYKVTTVHENGCVSDTGYTTVIVIPFSARINDTSICEGTPAFLSGQVYAPDSFGGYQYEWTPGAGLDNPYVQQPGFTREPGTYTYRFTVTSGSPVQCTATDTAIVTVLPGVILTNVTEDQVVRYGESVQLHAEGADHYVWSPLDYLSHAYIQSPVATPEETIEYTVEGFRTDGCSNTATVRIGVDKTVHDFIPTAFTPNGDGKNDVFRVANLTTQKLLEFRVFNRWGEEVFATSDKTQGWDGTWKGEPQASGTYTYLVRMIYPDNPLKVKMYTGSVMLIR